MLLETLLFSCEMLIFPRGFGFGAGAGATGDSKAVDFPRPAVGSTAETRRVGTCRDLHSAINSIVHWFAVVVCDSKARSSKSGSVESRMISRQLKPESIPAKHN